MVGAVFFFISLIGLVVLFYSMYRVYVGYYKPLMQLWKAIECIDFSKSSIDLTKLEELQPYGSKMSVSLINKFKELADIICMRIDNINDITDIAEHDKLTGCYNRAKLEKSKHRYVNGSSFNIIFIDVNNLKKMNDINGHEAGDTLLRTAATKLRFWDDFGDVYRLGGDEFLVVVPDESLSNINKLIATWYPKVGVLNRSTDEFKCVLSYGVARGVMGDNFDEVMEKADVKMYEMKKAIKKKFNETMR